MLVYLNMISQDCFWLLAYFIHKHMKRIEQQAVPVEAKPVHPIWILLKGGIKPSKKCYCLFFFLPSHSQVIREKFGVQCFLGLTATATQSTAADVAKHLGIDNLEEAVVRGSPVPKNLFLSVSRDQNREEVLNLFLNPEDKCCSLFISSFKITFIVLIFQLQKTVNYIHIESNCNV